MTDHSAGTAAGNATATGTKLEPDAIGAAQDTIIGMASSAPAATVGLTFAGLAATAAYGAGPILLLTAIPMLIIANAYRRLNLWKANTGALRMGRPGDQPLSRLPDRLAHGRRLHHRDHGRGPPARAFRARGVRLQFHGYLGLRGHWCGDGADHASDRRRRHQDHGPSPGQHGPGGIPDPGRPGHRRPGLGAQPPPRLGAVQQRSPPSCTTGAASSAAPGTW